MQFPIDITFKMLGWTARIHVTDATGRMIGYVPFTKRREGHLPIFSDEHMGMPIYTLRAENPLVCWFENAEGRRFGGYEVIPTAVGKFVIVDGVPRYQFEDHSGFLEFVDRMVPNLPILNGLTGLFLRPRTNAVRKPDGVNVLSVVKKRMMIDVRYTLKAHEEMSGPDQECLMLSAIYLSMLDLYIKMH